MPPRFDLPAFYLPYPARLNPGRDTARAHTRRWAQEMGMLGPPRDADTVQVWSERQFDAMDFALLCACTHPDAPGPELDLVTDWYVSVFYSDDHFLETFKRTRDLDGARKHLNPLQSFMPPRPVAPPAPANPVERGLAYLPPRTLPGMPHALAGTVHPQHPRPPPGADVGTAAHQRGQRAQPDRLHREPPQGRRRTVVGRPGRARLVERPERHATV